MSQDAEKYLYFKVGLLKDSFTLEALWQDALRYHMIDQPAQLIALRLTEYYELTKKDPAYSTLIPTAISDREAKEEIETPVASSLVTHSLATHQPIAHLPVIHSTTPISSTNTSATLESKNDIHVGSETSLTLSAGVDQNAEDAADYWSLL
jgi:hypothetical protein